MTPIQFQKQIRLQRARILLRTQATTAADVGYEVGYTSPAHFTREYHKALRSNPRRRPNKYHLSGGGRGFLSCYNQ
jgi:transcriptional regulator GlxA family with amidase domain